MNEKNNIDLDILQHIESLSNEINRVMASHTKSVLRRYPVTFTLLVLFGVIAVSDGVKGILNDIGFVNHPIYSLILGLIILTATGTLYKKLDKKIE